MTRYCALLAGLAFFTAALPCLSHGQIDATITSIVDRFNHIEENLSSMKVIRADASHADSDWPLGIIEVWLENGDIAKVRNEHRTSDSLTVQEFWLEGNLPMFAFERSEWHGNQDGSVNITEYRFYLDEGKAIREMSRSDTRQKEQGVDISGVAHQTNDEFDAEYARSLYDDKDKQIAELLNVAHAFTRRAPDAPDLLALPYRVLLNTLSPDAKFAFAWGMEGVDQPDWKQWEERQYEYLDTLGDIYYQLHLVSLATGESLGRIESEFDPSGRPYFWSKWAEDSSLVATGSDYRWATGSAHVYGIGNGGVVLAGDLGTALSRIAIQVLKEKDHPYALDAVEATGFIDIRSLTPEGLMEVGYGIESKFEGPRRNAQLDLEIQTDFDNGTFNLLKAELPDYEPTPTSWEKLKTLLMSSAPQWLTSPPVLPDYLQAETFLDDGILYLFNQFGTAIDPDLIEILIRQPLFVDGPHYPGGIVTQSRFDFGKYDPSSVRIVAQEFRKILSPEMVQATQSLYDAKFRSMAHHFNESLVYWHNNPDELERQKVAYLDHIEKQTLPEFYYLLDGNLAESLMNNYSEDWTERTCYLTGLRFWLRRSCDGSFPEFAGLLQNVIAAYEPSYFSARGVPDLRVDSWDEEEGEGMVEVVMTESGAIGVNHLTEFSLTGLQAALPGLEVREKEFFDQGGQHPAFAAFLGSSEVLTLIRFDSGDPLAFEARSSNIQLKNGISTGDTFAHVFRRQRPLGYFNGLESDIGAVMVEAPGSEKITLLFEPPPGTLVPNPDLSIAEMKDFILKEMRWMP